MSQEKIWEKEYQNPLLVTKHDKPQADVLRFLKYLKKTQGLRAENLKVLDLGSGTGRNANYLAGRGNAVTGVEISNTAINLAKERSEGLLNPPDYLKQSMGQPWPLADKSIDLVLDIISSNSLNEVERLLYISELRRVLKPGGYIFVKTLCKDGDRNSAQLLKNSPGPEKDTYIMPDLGLTERIFSKSDFLETYMDFEVVGIETKTAHIPFNGQIFNRKFLLAYLKAH